MFRDKNKNKIFKEPRIIVIFLTSFFLLVLSGVLIYLAPKELPWIILTIIMAQFSASIFFPIIVGYFQEIFKEKEAGETIWRAFREFSEGGILRVYKDREGNEFKENALTDLKKAFGEHRNGKVKLIGVSLRVFFNQTGPFYSNITNICDLHKINENILIQALVCNANNNPEVMNRAKIETPDRLNDPLIKIDINSTIVSIQNLNKLYGTGSIKYNQYLSAPYCTAIIFPSKCYFSPNLLSPIAPIRLPMIVFAMNSPGYLKINNYFDYLWNMCTKNKEKQGGGKI